MEGLGGLGGIRKGGNEGRAEWGEWRNWMLVLSHDQHGTQGHPGASPGVPIPDALDRPGTSTGYPRKRRRGIRERNWMPSLVLKTVCVSFLGAQSWH